MNIFNEEQKSFLVLLLIYEVEFIIVGGVSVIYHGYVRTTGDLDLWVEPSNDNKKKLIPAIRAAGISEESITILDSKDFTKAIAFHFNQPPNRIEMLTHISGLNFQEARQRCECLEMEHQQVPLLAYDDLITNKLMTGRLKDKADVEELQKIHRYRE
ncbi:MAG: DUF6036 family nucleotidyltransferase [Bacteroidota bacterium]